MKRWDFFVSYSTQDKEWALWIARILIKNGYAVCAQALNILPGDDFLDKMEKFLEHSENVLAVWSSNYSKSYYGKMEWKAAIVGQSKGQIGCLLPVRIDSQPMGLLFSTLVSVDLPNMNEESEKKLINAVRRAVPISLTQKEEGKRLFQSGEDYRHKKDYANAQECWKQAAEKGNVSALYALGELYHDGIGVEQDATTAHQYWKRARERWEQEAETGDASALYALGELYYSGRGVNRDYTTARKYWEEAEDNTDALYALGSLYECGYGVDVDYDRAWGYYKQAEEKGNTVALYNLGMFCERGYGKRDINYAQALEYYQKAVAFGNEDAVARVEALRAKLDG